MRRVIWLAGAPLIVIFCVLPPIATVSGATANLIAPGKSIGRIYLGEEGRQLAWLGQSSYADAAMGHFWGFWRSTKTGRVLGIYTVRNDYGDKTFVRTVFTDSPAFYTSKGVHSGSRLDQILVDYPHTIRVTSIDDTARSGAYAVYDNAAAGISFQVYRPTEECTGILIHTRGIPVTQEYAQLPDNTRWGDPKNY